MSLLHPQRYLLPSSLGPVSYFAWRCLFGALLLFCFNQSLLNSKVGYFCHQKSAASPPAAFLEFAHRTPQEGRMGKAKLLGAQERQRHLSCCLFPTPHLKPARARGPTYEYSHEQARVCPSDRLLQGHLSARPSPVLSRTF